MKSGGTGYTCPVQSFACPTCGQLLFAHNSRCVRCGTEVGWVVPGPDEESGDLLALTDDRARCANARVASCNWLVVPTEALRWDGRCLSCRLTSTRPRDDDTRAMAAFARAEADKRYLIVQLLRLRLPVVPLLTDPDRGLAFDLLSSSEQPVVTGHAHGLVTIDLAEGHDEHREAVRSAMAEPYRTMLGHLRHEVGHRYWQLLVEQEPDRLERFRELFGDERTDYAEALRRHYGDGSGPPGVGSDWKEAHVSSYASTHPWEDWAETFAHYLHITDTLHTAAEYGTVVSGPRAPGLRRSLMAVPQADAQSWVGIDALLATWLPLSYALNAMNRAMGQRNLYPFVLRAPVVEKLGFVHELVQARQVAAA